MSTRLDWRRVEELFAWAVEHDPSQRSRELAARCEGDGELASEVGSLVQAWSSSADFLETPAADRIVQAESDPRRGARIGRYRLVRAIGRGGMGVVYEAWQDDPRRVVALKLVRAGSLADPLRVRRFQREAESLGRLDHPGIARIFEAGLDEESGDHWFAMELVRGRPLAEYVRAERPERTVLLDLFARIAWAVEHAHGQGVVHRDLKPSNVLVVDGEGEPQVKVLDFGLAHCTSVGSVETTRLTEPGRVYGTLPYMSPEQARGEPASSGPPSDIYSLGVILYELLTGRLPIDVEGLQLPAAVRSISESEPDRPGRIDRALRGDLETILLKALEKEPSRRYASAAALARDVERHLAGLPIAARPPTVLYQARKLVQRHKLLFGVLLSSFLFLAAASVVSGVLYARAREAEQRARVEAQTSLDINRFLQEMLASAQPGVHADHELSVREVLERAADRLEREPIEHPEVGAALHATIGDAYRALGLFERAEKHLEHALATDRARPAEPATLAKDLSALSLVRLEQGRYADAEALAREALALARALGPSRTVAEILVQLGRAVLLRAASTTALEEARVHYEEALALAQDPALGDRELTAKVYNELGAALASLGDNTGAVQHYRRALELHSELFGDLDLRVAEDRNDLAIVLARAELLPEAIALTRRSLASYEQILGREHPTTVAIVNNLGSLLVRGPALDDGEALLVEALEARRRLLGDDHPDVARTLSLLGHAARMREDLAGARACFEDALTIFRAALGPYHVEVGNAESSLALIEQQAGDPERALPHARAALEVYERVLPADHFFIPQGEGLVGRVLLALGERAEAEKLLARSLETLAKLGGDANPATQRALADLAALHRANGAPEKAEALEARLRVRWSGGASR